MLREVMIKQSKQCFSKLLLSIPLAPSFCDCVSLKENIQKIEPFLYDLKEGGGFRMWKILLWPCWAAGRPHRPSIQRFNWPESFFYPFVIRRRGGSPARRPWPALGQIHIWVPVLLLLHPSSAGAWAWPGTERSIFSVHESVQMYTFVHSQN